MPSTDSECPVDKKINISSIRNHSKVRTQVKQVMGNLEDVLGELKSVVGEMKGLVSHIDTVTDKMDQGWPQPCRRLSAPGPSLPVKARPSLRQSMSTEGVPSRPQSADYSSGTNNRISTLWKHCQFIAVPESRVEPVTGTNKSSKKYDFLLIPREHFLRYILSHASKHDVAKGTTPKMKKSHDYENVNIFRGKNIEPKFQSKHYENVMIRKSEVGLDNATCELVSDKHEVCCTVEEELRTSQHRREVAASRDVDIDSCNSSMVYSMMGRKRKIGPSKASSVEHSLNDETQDIYESNVCSSNECCCQNDGNGTQDPSCNYCDIYERELNEKLEWEFLEDLPWQSEDDGAWQSEELLWRNADAGEETDTEPEIMKAKAMSTSSHHTQVNMWRRCTPDSLDLADSGVAADDEYYSDTESDLQPVEYNLRQNLMPRAAGGKLVNYSWRTVVPP